MTGIARTERGTTGRSTRDELTEEAGFLRRSLEDLDRERAAGDLDTADYEALRASYEGRSRAIEAVLEQLDVSAVADVPDTARAETAHADTAGDAKRPGGARARLSSRHHRLLLGWSAAVCFALAGTLVGLALADVEPFAQSPPLSPATQIQIELGEAGTLAANHEIVQAVTVYGKVLDLDPQQPEALANDGWLVRLAGLSSRSSRLVTAGDAEIATAVKVAPGYALARAYDAVALYQDEHSAGAAVSEFKAMLADQPSATLSASVRTVASAAYSAAGVALPHALASAAG